MQPNSHDNPDYISALKDFDDASKQLSNARKKAKEAADGQSHYISGVDKSLVNRVKAARSRLYEERKKLSGTHWHRTA